MDKFRVAFPGITLPANCGGLRAIVLFSLSKATDPNVTFATCIDVRGRVFQMVPIPLSELKAAPHLAFIETEADPNAPVAGRSGIVGPDGRML